MISSLTRGTEKSFFPHHLGPFILPGHLQHKELGLNFQLQNNITILSSKSTFPAGSTIRYQKLILLPGVAVKPQWKMDVKNTYKCSICCALQPAKPTTQEAPSLLTASPPKEPRETGEGSAFKVPVVINKPLVQKQTIIRC